MWLILILSAIVAVLIYLRANRLNYWKRRHVESLPNSHYLFGDIKQVLFGRENLAATMQRAYSVFKPQGVKYFGLYFMRTPIFVPIDPQMIRDIMVKDFDYFVDRGIHIDFEKDQLAANLFNLRGNEWRTMRQKLTSTFTSGKLKGMMDALHLHVGHLITKVQDNLKMGQEEMVLNNYFEQLGIDIIGQVAFGLDINTLNGQNANFYAMVKRIFHPTFSNLTKFLLFGGVSNPGNVIALTTYDKEMTGFFMSLIKETIEHRKTQNGAPPKDFLQLLLDLHEKHEISIEQIAAQTFIFFIAAFETSSKAADFTMYELSKNLPLQQQLREEIKTNIKNYSYEEIMQNKLLDMIFKESLRKHPTVVFLHRECSKPYKVSPDTTLEKGQVLLMPIYAIHKDAEYFPEPDVFDPMRFDEEKSVYKKIDPLTYYPFGDGPRNCIGMRFGILQVKLTIAKLVSHFEILPSAKTKEPFVFNPITDNLLLTYKDPVYFNVKTL